VTDAPPIARYRSPHGFEGEPCSDRRIGTLGDNSLSHTDMHTHTFA